MAADQAVQIPLETPEPKWRLGTVLLFRFCFIYFALYCLSTQILSGFAPIPGFDFSDPASLWPVRPLVLWVAKHIFHITSALVYSGSGSGDKTFDWVLSFCLLMIALSGVVLWSALDRGPAEYVRLNAYFRLFLRLALAGQMLVYGMVKVVPLQMPFPYLSRLIEPFGNFSPMGVLWSSVGSMRSYEVFVGSAELLAGLLLIVPRTSMLGALVCLIDAIEIFVLNMTYDVPVKLFSFHLILMSLYLLAPDFRRLANFLLLNRAIPPSSVREIFKTSRAKKIALAAQVVFGIALVGGNLTGAKDAWKEYGGAREKSPLYGIWTIDRMSIDGVFRSPLLTDYGRWHRAIFDFANFTSFERMDGSLVYYKTAVDAKNHLLNFTQASDKKWRGALRFERKAPDDLVLDGSMGSRKLRMELTRFDLNKFPLVNRGFHWIQEYPFNR